MGRAGETILGIDLGTSFSSAAALIDGRIHLVTDGRGEACFPSVVHFPRSGPPLAGFEAERLRASDPTNTITGIKRVIGRAGDSPAATLLDHSAAFELVARCGEEVAVRVRGGTFSATEVAAIILRHIRDRAATRFGQDVRRALLTVPVTTPHSVKAAMVRCGAMAGLEVVGLVTEPVAGAAARGASGAAAPFLVYDFGGGTFDATVVRGNGKTLEVLADGGDDCLGGDDLDLAFARWVASGIWRFRKLDATHDVILWQRIQRQCEAVKRALSASPVVRYFLEDALPGSGSRDIDVTVKREHLDEPWSELVLRSVATALDTVSRSGVAAAKLAGALLIGGTTFVPQVRAAVSGVFPGRIIAEEDPQTAVARGAALIAARPELLGAA